METKENKNGNEIRESRLNNMQRKALADSIKGHYQVLIDEAKQKKESEQETAVEHARKRLGYHLLKKRISGLEDEKKDLENKLCELGFDSSGNLRTIYDSKTNQYVPAVSGAKRLIEGKSNDATKQLERERDQKVTKILLADSIKEAKLIMNF